MLVEIEQTVQSVQPGSRRVFAVNGATVYVRKPDGSEEPVYASSAGGTPVTQPLTTQNGRIEGWAEEGTHVDLVVGNAAGTSPQITGYTQRIIMGGPIGPQGPPGPDTQAALAARPPIDARQNDIANIVADGVTDDAAAWRLLKDNAPLGATITWRGNSRITSQVVWDRRVNLVGEGVGSAITVDVGALNDGLVLAPASGLLYGVRLSNFAVLGPASAARYALVLRNLAHSRVDNVYVKAGADWCVSIEGALINWINVICPGNNMTFPYAAANATNGIRVVGSTTHPANANFIDAIVEAMTGDGLVMDGTIGAAGSYNNWIEGTYEGLSGRGILIKGAAVLNWTVANAHLENTTGNALRVENARQGHIGPGVRTEALELVSVADTTVDGVDAFTATEDAASARNTFGRISTRAVGGFASAGAGTVIRHPVRHTAVDTSTAGVGPIEGGNLLRSGGLDFWDVTAKPFGSSIIAGTIAKTGNGQADTRKLLGELAGKMSGGAAVYHEGVAADELDPVKGRYVALSAWVYIPSAQVNQPTVVIECNVAGVTTHTGESTALTDQWVRLSITSLVGSAATALNLRLRNTNASTGDWYVDGTSVVIGRVGPRLVAERTPTRRTAEVAWNPPGIATGVAASVNVTVQGAVLGDQANASFSLGTGNSMLVTARVIAANTAQVTLTNMSGATQDLASGTLRVETWGY